MKICVCAKQVPDTNEVRIDPVKGTLIREGVPSILNPDDANALEAALQLKDEYKDTTISVISMGPPQATYMLRECLAMGADEAVLLSDRAFGGADTCATSTTIAAGIKMLGDVDIIFGGRQAIDGDTAQVGPQVAMRLGIPVVTYVQKIVEYTGDKIKVQRQLEDGYEVIEVKLPCFLTCVKELNEPRYMTPGGIFDAYDKEVTVLSRADLIDVDDSNIGLKGSPTQIAKASDKVRKGAGEQVNLGASESVDYIIGKLKETHII